MTGQILPHVPGLIVMDLADPSLDRDAAYAHLQQVKVMHLRYFPTYPHMLDELESWFVHGWPDPEVRVHVWLGLLDGEPALECIMHVNLRRQVMLTHYLAAIPALRRRAGRGWLTDVTAEWVRTGQADCAGVGRDLWAVMAEVPPEHLHKWLRSGFGHIGIDYAEPLGGRYRQLDRPPLYSRMWPILLVTEAGRQQPYPEVARRGLAAFLRDYYLVPEADPRGAAMFAAAADCDGPTISQSWAARMLVGPAG